MLVHILMIIAAAATGAAGVTAQQQARTADSGVYTAAQAARGARVFDTQCATCHREPGGVAAVPAGERFTRMFSDAALATLFNTIKTTMPRTAPGSLGDADYIDIVAHLLRLNGFPEGAVELGAAGLAEIKIPGQAGALDFSLIQVVGCLVQGPGRVWTLTAGTEPARTREPDPAGSEEAAQLDAMPPGTRTFRLQQIYGPPAGWMGQKIAVKGFLYATDTETRVSVTSTRTLPGACQN